MDAYAFAEPLEEGIILERPNRFIMMVQKGGKVHRCHCPSTGRIGNLVFRDIPCLLSSARTEGRSTAYTVEAISLDAPEKKRKSWIGINQGKVNAYVEHFLRTGQLDGMIKKGATVERERKLGDSRIDFRIGRHYLEVKMPLITLPTGGPALRKPGSRFDSFDRLIRHFHDLGRSLHGDSRALVILCYAYDARPFQPPPLDRTNSRIIRAAREASRKGVENWQINMRVTPKGVRLLKCFPLDLFSS
ncbi:MAG: DNA/RNA nuclease SfsA [DPANN group archaeon]|nr:DNA/RNA nuclease SfsA [DPANN group archaeon]